jgi:hypothetical protein
VNDPGALPSVEAVIDEPPSALPPMWVIALAVDGVVLLLLLTGLFFLVRTLIG